MKVSVITIAYNNREALHRTIKSVVGQNYSDLEYIVIDGGSNDGSVEVLKAFEDAIDYWVSEKDSGIYHAMNKGIKAATGEYVLFLNSGDTFLERASLAQIVEFWTPEVAIIYGDLRVCTEQREFVKSYPDSLDFNFFLRESLPHPGTLIKRELFGIIGPYDQEYEITADWVFFVLCICGKEVMYRHCPVVISIFYYDGLSSRSENFPKIAEEKLRFLIRHFPDEVKRLDVRNPMRVFFPWSSMSPLQKLWYRLKRKIKSYVTVSKHSCNLL